MFKKAQRKSAKLRLALAGPAGSGKTYSALLIARGLGGPVAMIDTEHGSGELYADLYDYDVATLTPPFSPERYIQLIREAEKADYNIIVIDSLSHAWAGEGGVLDIHDRATRSTRNSFTAWCEVTPQHNALVEAMLQSPCHIIATVRTKTAYEVQQEGNKTKVVKVGLAPIQRDGLEFEFSVVLDLSIEGHVACASKDRTRLLDGKYFTPTEETGRQLLEWLNMGADSKHEIIQQIQTLLTSLDLSATADAYWIYAGNKYRASTMDELTEAQLQEQIRLLTQCQQNPSKLDQFHKLLAELSNQQMVSSQDLHQETAH